MQLSIVSALSLVVPFVGGRGVGSWGPSPLNLQPSLEYPVSLYSLFVLLAPPHRRAQDLTGLIRALSIEVKKGHPDSLILASQSLLFQVWLESLLLESKLSPFCPLTKISIPESRV